MSTRLRLAATVLLALPLAACAERQQTGSAEPAVEETAVDPSESSPGEPTPSEPSPSESAPPESEAGFGRSGPIAVTGTADVEEAVVVSGSAVGGDVSPLAFPLETPQERQDFGAAFERGFGREVARAARSLDTPGTTSWGTVAAVACQGPTSVRIDAGEAGFEVTPRLPKSTVQCLVPVTYVVVFAAPAAS